MSDNGNQKPNWSFRDDSRIDQNKIWILFEELIPVECSFGSVDHREGTRCRVRARYSWDGNNSSTHSVPNRFSGIHGLPTPQTNDNIATMIAHDRFQTINFLITTLTFELFCHQTYFCCLKRIPDSREKVFHPDDVPDQKSVLPRVGHRRAWSGLASGTCT